MKKTFLFLIIFLLSLPVQIYAICEGPIVPCGAEGMPACTLCHLFELLNNILEFFLTCLVPLTALFMIVLGGAMFILSRLEIVPINIFSQAKQIVTAVFVGLVIIFSSWVFLNTFLTVIGVAEWTGLGDNWWEITCSPPGE